MTNTYTEISANSLEWLRQWSAIIMMMEQSFDPKTRMRYQQMYSIPMEDGKRIALLLKHEMSVSPLIIIIPDKKHQFQEEEQENQKNLRQTRRKKFREEKLRTVHLYKK